ncbi:MAG: GbsR/MarR family transcriptional regulator [Candidatus Methylacidiphilales bacterium]|nr:MarR family transcriptional regulator [Candidatus Methylacidiphilales bacterium]
MKEALAILPDPEDDSNQEALRHARDKFVTEWGAMGSMWGISRTMAQVHALLLVSPQPLTTDEIMEELKISRGNAHANLRELVGWGLIRGVIRKGERKEYFEAEKDVWRMFCVIARERKRREIEPVVKVLRECGETTKLLQGAEAREFNQQIAALRQLVEIADTAMDKISKAEQADVMPFLTGFQG